MDTLHINNQKNKGKLSNGEKIQDRPKISNGRRLEWNNNSRDALINAKNRFMYIV